MRMLVVGVLLMVVRVSAHHAFAAEYDAKKTVTVSGVVTEFKWSNPHAWVYVQGKDELGRVAKWGFEMGSPGGLTRRGWKREDLKKGDRITIDGFRAKNGSASANAGAVVLGDGRKLFGGFASTPGAPKRVNGWYLF